MYLVRNGRPVVYNLYLLYGDTVLIASQSIKKRPDYNKLSYYTICTPLMENNKVVENELFIIFKKKEILIIVCQLLLSMGGIVYIQLDRTGPSAVVAYIRCRQVKCNMKCIQIARFVLNNVRFERILRKGAD